MTSREKILGRIREALQAKAPVPGQHGEAHAAPAQTDTAGIRHWLPSVGASWEQQRDLFAQNSAALKTEFIVVPNAAAAGVEIKRIAEAGQWRRLAAHQTPLLAEVVAGVGVATLWTDPGYATKDLEPCDGGVTECESLVAQTGSVLVTTRSSGGRALSVLPPHHIVVATREQLVPDLSAAFELMRRQYDGNYPSTISFITGPSRTGDIERILVLGAHGPKALTVLLIDSPAASAGR
jgi:L-lactate dehydrogenase complex protein LldG